MYFNFWKGICTSLLIFQSFFSFSQAVPLRFQGNVSDDNTDLSAASIQVLQGGKVVNTVQTDRLGNYSFELPLGGDYIVVVSKEGYVAKKFSHQWCSSRKSKHQVSYRRSQAFAV